MNKKGEELYELDRDELVQELMNATGIEITEDYPGVGPHDLSLSTWNTADGYDVYVLTNANHYEHISFENDVFYYQPDMNTILDRLYELREGEIFYVDDIEEYFQDEDAIIQFLMDNYPEKYDPDFEEDHGPTGGFSKRFK